MIEPNSIIHGDCLEVMKDIADKSIDCIICDLPYGITDSKWDSVIPFETLWEQYKRIIKPNGAIVLFGSQPFTSALVMSNPKWFKYEWIWDKKIPSGMSYARYQPMRQHENILIFYNNKCIYNPQLVRRVSPIKGGGMTKGESTKNQNLIPLHKTYDYKNPVSLICANKIRYGGQHPTQKPVPLLEYLIKTYTIEGELILDNTAGSGSLAIAAINTKRNYICIEKDDHYFEVMKERIANHDPNAPVKKPKVKAEVKGQLVLF